MAKPAFLFDLDMTLLDTSELESYRDSGQWKYVRENLSSVKPFPRKDGIHVHQIPSILQANKSPVAIVTSSPRWYAVALLKKFGIECDVLVTYGDTTTHKPDPEPLRLALEKLGHPRVAYHVGDKSSDTEASYHAQVISIGAAWGAKEKKDFWKIAPDIALFDEPLLLEPHNLPRRGYVGEVISHNFEPLCHDGGVLSWEEVDLGTCFALGRYFTTNDSRHSSSNFSKNILSLKNDDSTAELFGKMLQGFLENFVGPYFTMVPVPPKPGQRNRFERVLDFVKIKHISIAPNGLRTVREIDGYKRLRPVERLETVKDVFKSNQKSWTGHHIILIDDVYTSGATIRECVRILRKSGALRVIPAVFGKDQPTLSRKECPKCGRLMHIRRRKSDEHPFWGCGGYPDYCNYTENID